MRKTALLMAVLVCLATVSVPSAEALCPKCVTISAGVERFEAVKPEPKVKAACQLYAAFVCDEQKPKDFPQITWIVQENTLGFRTSCGERIFHIRE